MRPRFLTQSKRCEAYPFLKKLKVLICYAQFMLSYLLNVCFLRRTMVSIIGVVHLVSVTASQASTQVRDGLANFPQNLRAI